MSDNKYDANMKKLLYIYIIFIREMKDQNFININNKRTIRDTLHSYFTV